MDIEHSATYKALPTHVKPAWLRAVGALPPAWLNAPATGEVFKGKDDCMRRLQGWALFEGFAVVQGRVWKNQTPRWQFLCKQHGTKTANKRGLEARKGKDEEGNVVTDRQRDTMIKAKKDCHFEYCLSYKPVSQGSPEKQYKKNHGKANAPGLTAAEASDKDRKEHERLTKIAGKAKATSEDVAEEEEDDGIHTRDSPTPRAGEPQGGTTSPASRVAYPCPMPHEDPSLLPPSTAPSRLGESGSTKRTRGRTMDFVALHTGAVSKKGKR